MTVALTFNASTGVTSAAAFGNPVVTCQNLGDRNDWEGRSMMPGRHTMAAQGVVPMARLSARLVLHREMPA